MKKKHLPKIKPSKSTIIRGAYDMKGEWWCENDIQIFTGGMITMFFGRNREQIKIIERESKTH